MKLYLKIAKIGVLIQSKDLLSIITESEKRLLKPFLTHPKSDKGYFTVSAKFVEENTKINHQNARSLLKKIKHDFPTKTSLDADIAIRSFKYNWLDVFKSGIDKNCLPIMTPYSFFIFNKKSGHCDILLKKTKILCSQRAFPAYQHFLFTLKVLFRLILNSKNNGILLHASSFKNKNAGYVFLGASNYGKSTIIKILGTENALSDDSSIIKKMGRKYMVFANPWWNRGRSLKNQNVSETATLKAIFLINRSTKTEIKKTPYKQALAELLYSDSPFQQIRFFDNISGIKGFYLFAENMLRNIPVFNLYVKKHWNFKKEFKNLLSIYNL